MKRTSLFFLLLAACVVALFYIGSHKNAAAASHFNRPNDPFLFRSVLDRQPRMVTLALDDNLWASYSADSCSLYKVWKGGVDFDGAVYTMRHGPQPMSIGNAYFVNSHRQPWRVEMGGASERPAVEYKGHRFANGQAEIFYDLILKNGQRIRVNERPEYAERDRQPAFERRFRVENAPADAKIFMETNTASMISESNIEADAGQFSIKKEGKKLVGDLTSLEIDGELALKTDGETKLTTFFTNHPLVENPNEAERLAEASRLTAGERIINKSDCRTCHNPTEKTVGPAYVQIAAKYLNTPENLDLLTKKVKTGGSGVWGAAAMSAHSDMSEADISTVVAYILDFDKADDKGEGKKAAAPTKTLKPIDVNVEGLAAGLSTSIWKTDKAAGAFSKIDFSKKPTTIGLLENLSMGDNELAAIGLTDNFALRSEGFLNLNEDKNIDFRLISDDGSRLFINDQLMIDNDGFHGAEAADCEVQLKKGFHKIRVEYWQGEGGRDIELLWAPHGSIKFEPVPAAFFQHGKIDGSETQLGGTAAAKIAGDGIDEAGVHPSFDLSQARPEAFLPKVGGMDFDSKGNLFVSTWDPSGSVYKLTGVETGDPKKIKVQQVAKGLAEPLGLKIVNDELFVLQKQELTKLVDTDGDGVMDEYQSFSHGWRASGNFHEFAFGLAYKAGFFYATLAIAIMPGGASARPQIPDRGKVVKIDAKTGKMEFIANGLRTPNGIGLGTDDELFVADNQGDWLPASKILHITEGAFFNSFAVDSAANSLKKIKPPVVWLPQDEIGNSPSQPTVFHDGIYKNQMLHGDVCHGGLKRVFVEKIGGEYQGCVFRFSQGIEGGTNRLVWGPDGGLYVGCIGNPGNWGHQGGLWYGLQRLKPNGKPTFEMLAVRAKTNGLEVEFTEPLEEDAGWNAADFLVKQWWYKPTNKYGGPKMDETALKVLSSSVSADRKKVFLEVAGMKAGQVVYLKLPNTLLSENERELWSTEAWYTLNQIPENAMGEKLAAPEMEKTDDNTLSKKEIRKGWKLLFDGKSLAGWRNFKKQTIGKSWVIDDHAIHLDAKPSATGSWHTDDGGDIITLDEFENYELRLDWRIGECGNSGIIFNVSEEGGFDYVWQTGPEMQVLDNRCHPDAKILKHRAGDLYDLITVNRETVKPQGEWNHIRLKVKNGKLQFWLNGHKTVETQMWDDAWRKMIAGSKFKDMKGFGTYKKGHIALQDHGNLVWFKNIKVRQLD